MVWEVAYSFSPLDKKFLLGKLYVKQNMAEVSDTGEGSKRSLLSRMFKSRSHPTDSRLERALNRDRIFSQNQEIESRAQTNPTYRSVREAILERLPLNEKSQAKAIEALNNNIRNGNSTLMQLPIKDIHDEQRGLAILSKLGMLGTKGSEFGGRSLSSFYDGSGGHLRTFICRDERGRDQMRRELSGIEAEVMYGQSSQSSRGLPESFKITANPEALGRLQAVLR